MNNYSCVKRRRAPLPHASKKTPCYCSPKRRCRSKSTRKTVRSSCLSHSQSALNILTHNVTSPKLFHANTPTMVQSVSHSLLDRPAPIDEQLRSNYERMFQFLENLQKERFSHVRENLTKLHSNIEI